MLNYLKNVLENIPSGWLSTTTHRLDIYDEKFVYYQSWKDGERVEGYYKFLETDYDNHFIDLPDSEDVMEQDDDACFELNMSDEVQQKLGI